MQESNLINENQELKNKINELEYRVNKLEKINRRKTIISIITTILYILIFIFMSYYAYKTYKYYNDKYIQPYLKQIQDITSNQSFNTNYYIEGNN